MRGPVAFSFGSGARHFESHEALSAALIAASAAPTTTILVKGSRGSAMDRIVNALLEGEGNDAA